MNERVAASDFNATDYWGEDGDFQAYSFAEDLAEYYPVKTSVEADKVWWHTGEVWERWGEQNIRKEIRMILRDTATKSIVDETVRNLKHLTRTRRDDIFDLPPQKLVVGNGVIDLITGEFTPSKPGNRPGSQVKVDVEYDPEAIPHHFKDFLFDILHEDDVSIMWELIGYTLYRGYPFQKAALFLGEGANGKSTLLSALTEFLGQENVSGVELQALGSDRFASADLEGKLANIAQELDDSTLEHTGEFKKLTGGDVVRAQRKYEDSFQFENAATLIFAANQAPDAADDTFAYRRRWLYFDFPNTFTGDDAVPQDTLLQRFREEQPGILNMAVRAFGDLWARGGFEETHYMAEHEDAHDKATNPAYLFASEHLTSEEGALIRIDDAETAFQDWCDDTGRPTQGTQAFKRAVRSVHSPEVGKDPDDRRFKVWRGIRLVEDSGGDTEEEESTVPQRTLTK